MGWKILLLVLIVGIFFVSGCMEKECIVDEDCVEASCCHAAECVPKLQTPNCEGIYCSMECKPETLDCGQGSCKCINGECGVVIK